MRPWIGPYIVKAKLGHVGYKLESKIENKILWMHRKCLRRISADVVETREPQSVMFPDSLQSVDRITGIQNRSNKDVQIKRYFRVKVSGMHS